MSGTCKDCRFWGVPRKQRTSKSGVGSCLLANLIGFPNPPYKHLAIDDANGMAELLTTADFGCNQFQSRRTDDSA